MRIVLTLLLSTFALLYAQVPYISDPLLNDPITHKEDWDKLMVKVEVPIFEQNPMVNSILLPNDYVSSKLTNTKAWPVEKKYIILGVKLIFTKYPENFDDWKTNYYQLMADRFKALFKLDPRFNDKKIPYRIVLQTNCKSENEASKMFHGFEILYQKTPPFTDAIEDMKIDPKLQDYIDKKGGTRGLGVLQVLQSLNLDSTLIVIDCTGSMAPYKSQVLLWLSLNEEEGRKKFFSLMNDDKSISDTLGNFGGVYTGVYTTADEVMHKYDTLDFTLHNNPEAAENNVEAILRGIKKFPFVKSVLMLADMESCVIDVNYSKCIPRPVYIIADGKEQYPNPHYFQIAAMSGGSVYIGNQNWLTAKSILSGEEFTVGTSSYRYDPIRGYVICSRKTSNVNMRWFDCDEFYKLPGCR